MKEKIKNRVGYWVESAYYDLKTAESMLKEKRYLYVGFCCHLTAEKLIKACFWKIKNEEPPFTHNINIILDKLELLDKVPLQHQNLIDELIPLNIKSRYPDDKERIYKLLNYNKCRSLIKRTKEFTQWTKKLINQ
ncbi:MAG: HEPN domain-containing protein [Ignavibacteriales bacterium]|nr:HEPN domain-containing protein [Ignavibacteriales bacterium]